MKPYTSAENSASTTGTTEPSTNNTEPQTGQGETALHQLSNQNKTTNEVSSEIIISVQILHVLPNEEQQPSIHAQRLTQSNDHHKFGHSRDKEIFGLLEQGVFAFEPCSMSEGSCLFKSHFCAYTEDKGLPTDFEKSRFVVMAYNDTDHGYITHAPNVQRSSQRLLLCLAACGTSLTLFARDVIQVYPQSQTSLARPFLWSHLKFPTFRNISSLNLNFPSTVYPKQEHTGNIPIIIITRFDYK